MVRDCEWVDGWRLCESLASERRYPPNARQPLDVCDYHARLYDALQTVVQLYDERGERDGRGIQERVYLTPQEVRLRFGEGAE